jgi:hypothetical protein
MNANDQFPTENGVDRLLLSFFKAELPDPFPMMKAPVNAELPMPVVMRNPHRGELTKSRLSLAASVALLVGGCWYLSGQMGTSTERPKVGKGDDSAKVIKEMRQPADDSKKPTMP